MVKLPKTFFSLLFLFLILSFSAMATNELEEKGYWPSANNAESSIGRTTIISTSFDSEGTSSSVAAGFDRQPLVIDLDQDGIPEIITTQGNSIILLHNNQGTLVTVAQYDLKRPQRQALAAYNTSNGLRVAGIFGTLGVQMTLREISYNGISINVTRTVNMTAIHPRHRPMTGLRCTSAGNNVTGDHVTAHNPQCYFVTNNSAVMHWMPENGSLQNFTLGLGNVNRMVLHTETALEDIDNDNNMELGFIVDIDSDGQEGIVIYDTVTHLRQLTKDDITQGGGTSDIGGIAFETPSTGGLSKIILSVMTDLGVNARGDIFVYDYDGTNSQSFEIMPQQAMSTATISNPLVADLIDDTPTGYAGLEACAITDSSDGSAAQYITCGSLENVSRIYRTTVPDNFISSITRISGADTNADGYIDIITSNGVWRPQSRTNRSFTLRTGGNVILADTLNDGIGEFVSSTTSSTWIISVTGANEPPTLTQSFGLTWVNPVCVNSTIRFTAAEYDETGQRPTGTNYYNDLDGDTERLEADCGIPGDNNVNGTFSAGTPFVECVYNDTGVYYATVYIYDAANPSDRSQSYDYVIQVIDGEEGVTCNRQGQIIGSAAVTGEPAITPTGVSGGLTEVIDYFTGGDEDSKLLIAFIVILAIVAFVAVKTQSNAAMAIVGVLAVIIVTAVGLLPVWILILFFLFLLMVAIIIFATGGNGG